MRDLTSDKLAPKTSNEKTVFYITSKQLPLFCPLPEMGLWNQHPRVYLPIESAGRAKCPYCSTEFIVKE